MAQATKVLEELSGFIDELVILDSHEHLPMEKDRSPEADVLAEWLTHYFSCDLVSAGLSDQGLEQARNSSGDLRERWQLVEDRFEGRKSAEHRKVEAH